MLLPTNGPTAASPLHAEPQKRWFACDRSHAVPLPPEEKLINSNSGKGNSKSSSSKDWNEITLTGGEKERDKSDERSGNVAVTIGGGYHTAQRGANDQKGFERKRNNNNNNKQVACCHCKFELSFLFGLAPFEAFRA